jgi:hypothetical protein
VTFLQDEKNHDFGDKIALRGRDVGVRTVWPPPVHRSGRIECGKTHTLDLFRHAAPVSAARFIAATR